MDLHSPAIATRQRVKRCTKAEAPLGIDRAVNSRRTHEGYGNLIHDIAQNVRPVLDLFSPRRFKRRTMPLRSLLLCVCLASTSGAFAGTMSPSAGPSKAVPLQVTYKVEEKPAKCPAGTHPQGGCVWLTGKALTPDTAWPEMRRLAIVDAPAPALPAGCNAATTTGVLQGKHGRIQFKGAGYYCPKTDTALYHYAFDTAQAKRSDLPVNGTIRYTGSSNSETFASSDK